jgi:hypothetical protein
MFVFVCAHSQVQLKVLQIILLAIGPQQKASDQVGESSILQGTWENACEVQCEV